MSSAPAESRTASRTPARSVLTARAILPILLGWGSFLVLSAAQPVLADGPPTPVLVTALAAIIAVIVVCASAAVTQAQRLAQRLGDPYGTLVLTLSVVLIEVILISAVMLGPGDHATIARDSIMAVSMIILNLVAGLCLIVGGLRHGVLHPSRAGASSYLTLLVVLLTTGLVLPALLGDGSYGTGQALVIAAATVLLYAFFLQQQMGPRRADFQEVDDEGSALAQQGSSSIAAVLREHRAEILTRAVVMVAALVPVVLISHDMAALLDDALGRAQAPAALSGLMIAAIVFLPETITALRAAAAGEIQRVSNLTHGALVSTVGLTVPAVLVIGMLTDQTVVLGESPVNLLLVGVSVLLTLVTFGSGRVTALHGAGHLMVFGLYALTVLA